ncbi:hypothetical protein BaRGS_00030279 [Batillaria attramentaria]|uniref:LIM zinc-binding domain-containing protein n=1 Tax=Batillaria attramentaria TaxID=370345 RepID=A0ABD0JTW0_9CAEN
MPSQTNVKELCAGCHCTIEDRYLLRVMDNSWHETCLQCALCHKPLVGSCFARDRQLYCKADYDNPLYLCTLLTTLTQQMTMVLASDIVSTVTSPHTFHFSRRGVDNEELFTRFCRCLRWGLGDRGCCLSMRQLAFPNNPHPPGGVKLVTVRIIDLLPPANQGRAVAVESAVARLTFVRTSWIFSEGRLVSVVECRQLLDPVFNRPDDVYVTAGQNEALENDRRHRDRNQNRKSRAQMMRRPLSFRLESRDSDRKSEPPKDPVVPKRN